MKPFSHIFVTLSFCSSFSAAARIALSLALVASVILSFSFSFIIFACYWIILCFSLSFFIARVDSASDSFSLFSIYACKIFCSGPPQCSSCIHQHNLKRIRLTLSSSSSFSFLSSFSSFLSFLFPGPIGASFTCVCQKNSADSVDSSQRVSDVSNTCSGGEFDGCEGRIRPFLDYTL